MSLRVVTIPAVVLALAACSGGDKKTDDTIIPDNRPARRATLAWGTTAAAAKNDVPRTDVFLAVTEETGKAVSYPVGTYDGTCTIIGAIEAYAALTAITCVHNGNGFQLHASGTRDEVTVLKMVVAEGKEPDPFAREPVTTIPIPLGAKIEAAAQ
jgi:hypothetical protein